MFRPELFFRAEHLLSYIRFLLESKSGRQYYLAIVQRQLRLRR